jgi:hypothetical protein
MRKVKRNPEVSFKFACISKRFTEIRTSSKKEKGGWLNFDKVD